MPNMQVVLVYLEWFRRDSLLKCVLQLKIAKKITKTPYFGGSRSFKVIDVGTPGKLVDYQAWRLKRLSRLLITRTSRRRSQS